EKKKDETPPEKAKEEKKPDVVDPDAAPEPEKKPAVARASVKKTSIEDGVFNPPEQVEQEKPDQDAPVYVQPNADDRSFLEGSLKPQEFEQIEVLEYFGKKNPEKYGSLADKAVKFYKGVYDYVESKR